MLCVGRGERHHMKQRDYEIQAEREKERELERLTAQENPTITDIIVHFTHPDHPLVYTEPDYKSFVCNSCAGNGRGKRYHCAQCQFDVHKLCAQSPITWLLPKMPPEEIERFGILREVIDTFAHPQHSVIAVYKQRSFMCDHCNNDGNGLRYYCDACDVVFHPVCAKHPTRLISYLHPQHELELKLRPRFKSCGQCGTKGSWSNNRMYKCKDCDFYLHPGCSQLPLYLLHPLHPAHPLVLKMSCNMYRCSACSRWQTHGLFKYSCTRCGVHFDHTCIMEKAILGLEDDVRHKYTEHHKITLLPVVNLISSYPPIRDDPPNATGNHPGHGNIFELSANILQLISDS